MTLCILKSHMGILSQGNRLSCWSLDTTFGGHWTICSEVARLSASETSQGRLCRPRGSTPFAGGLVYLKVEEGFPLDEVPFDLPFFPLGDDPADEGERTPGLTLPAAGSVKATTGK